MFVRAFDFKAEAGGKVLLVADHHIHVPGNLPVDLLRALLAADALPERRTVVQVVGDDDAVLPGGLHGFDHELGRRVAQRGENAARVQPARAKFAEDVVPIEVARLELAGGAVAAVGNAHRAPHPEAALGEIQAVAHRPPHAVVWHPLDELGGDTALEDEVLEQPADVVVRERGADGGPQAEAAPQAAGDIVFAAAFPDFELARGAHAPLAGVQPQHDFPQRNQIVSA